MRRFRTVVFWCHLLTGVAVSLVVLTMSVTGVLLTYQRQITAWADMRGLGGGAPTPGARRLPIAALVTSARQAAVAAPTAVTWRAGRDAPVEVAFGRERRVFVNRYTGAVLGEGSSAVRAFFRTVTNWHRWLGAGGENRAVGRAITGACNLGFLLLVVSGFYLWWPRKRTRAAFRNVVVLRRGLSGKARDFNWHNVIGLWLVLPLFIVVLSGAVISYPWATGLVYRLVGEAPPRAAVTQGPRPESGAVVPSTLDALLARAEQRLPGWRSISLTLPTAADAPATFMLDRGTGGEPQKRAQLTLVQTTGEEVRWEPFAAGTLGRRLRSILRFAHTGEVLGLPGQTLAGLASLGAMVLVWTGLALAWRRLRTRRARQAGVGDVPARWPRGVERENAA